MLGASKYRMFDTLDRTARRSTAASTVAISAGGRDQSFAELRERALRLANGLIALGVRPGTRVGVLMSNRHEWPEALFGITATGGVCVPINVLLRGLEAGHIVDDSDVDVLIVDERGELPLAELPRLPRTIITVGTVEVPAGANVRTYESVIESGAARPTGVLIGVEDPAMTYYTSGTTGRSKGATHSHQGITWNTMSQVHDLSIGSADRYLVVPSLSWAAGFHDVTLALMWTGGTNVLLPTGQVSMEMIIDQIVEHRISHTLLVPVLLRELAASPHLLERLRGSDLRWVLTGAEPVPAALTNELNAELPKCDVVQGYGMSEFPLIAALLRPEEAVEHAGKAGRATSITSLAVETAEGVITDLGEGEILTRSPAGMLCYHGKAEATEEAFRDGWFHTGDTGRLDAEGFLTVTGRKKDMIISGGMNIYPREIEDVIIAQLGIRDVAVVGVPDERWGEVPVVVLLSSSGGSADDVLRVCEEQLSSYKRPKRVLMRDEPFPRTPNGKLLKRELAPWAEAEIRVLTDEA
ncbi:MAG: AMP-binding protein [Actinobacteria bacterium]|uniref:Unannotated protein n=1 Tax=freshwater metagenome TaxID=449393 RepID=A0A6J7RCP5_9ZZZZ|nr:AMP-binding protein [Actinomycetota bacterium]